MIKQLFVAMIFSFCAGLLPAQNDSSFYELKEVRVSGFKEEQRLETSTGVAIVKPVIYGLLQEGGLGYRDC